MALNYLALTGNLGASAATGQATFTASGWLTDSTHEMLDPPLPVTATLSATGTFSQSLLATDSTGPLPAGWTWTVSFQLPGISAYGFSFFLPAGPLSFTATDGTPCLFTASGSAYANGDAVALSGSSLPAGFTAGVTYYVVNVSADTFNLAATSGGTAINSTSSGTGTVATAVTDISTLAPVEPAASMSAYLPLGGGTMTGPVNMGAQGITHLADGVNAQDAAAVSQLPLSLTGDSVQKIIVPLYVYPTYYDETGDYQTLQAGAPFASMVILNPDSGPGTYNVDWANQITELHASGVLALGYVATDYGGTAIATVEAQVATWYSYYPALDGIFFDQGAYLVATQPYYASLYAYVKALNTGKNLVVLNPGDIPDESYMACSDVICVCENTYSYYTTTFAGAIPDWVADYPAGRFLHVIYSADTVPQVLETLALSRTFRAGYVYVLDSAGLYTALAGDATSNPLIWSQQVDWCRNGYATGPSSALTLSVGGTVPWSYPYSSYWLNAGSAVTGLVLSLPSLTAVPPALIAPQAAQQVITLVNTSSASTMTFAASGTSNVADGTSDVIGAGSAHSYIWNGAGLWYRIS